jgi:hypothetical protein
MCLKSFRRERTLAKNLGIPFKWAKSVFPHSTYPVSMDLAEILEFVIAFYIISRPENLKSRNCVLNVAGLW